MTTQYRNLIVAAEPAEPTPSPYTGELATCWTVTVTRTKYPDRTARMQFFCAPTYDMTTRRGLLRALLTLCQCAQDGGMNLSEFRAVIAPFYENQYRGEVYTHYRDLRATLLNCLPNKYSLNALIHALRHDVPNIHD